MKVAAFILLITSIIFLIHERHLVTKFEQKFTEKLNEKSDLTLELIGRLKNTENCENQREYTYLPIVLEMWNKNDNLRTMKNVLNLMGFKKFKGRDHSWDLMWSIEFPFDRFPEKIKNLQMRPNQKMNHFPGVPHISNKMSLATRANSKFIQPAFQFPEDQLKFEAFALENPQKKFVVKNYANRGVRIVKKDEVSSINSDTSFIQAFMDNPLLIDGHSFDVGIYVLITSLEPLRIYRFKRECLLRFCAEPYYPFDENNTRKYVVGNEKLHIWDLKSFEGIENFPHIQMFKSHLTSNGHDVDALWNQFDEAITSTIIWGSKEIVDEMLYECEKYSCTNENFFELLRFDFIIDNEMNVHLMEINMSPNLTPAKDRYEKNRNQYEQVVYNTLRIIGAEGFVEFNDNRFSDVFSSPENIAVNFRECSAGNCSNCESVDCKFCSNCLDLDLEIALHTSYREHQRRGDFERIFPKTQHLNEKMFDEMTDLTQDLVKWFAVKCKEDSGWC